MITTSEFIESTFDVGFMTCVIDKAQNLVVTECDTHFSDFVGVHPSKIAQGKLFLYDVLMPKDREEIMRQLCKKNSPYIYFSFYIKNKSGKFIFVHATGQNYEDSTLCRLTLADVSRSVEKTEKYKARAKEMNHLIDLVAGGVALFKVNTDMHFIPLYLNETCCRILGTTKDKYRLQEARIDEFIHPEDRSIVFQAIGNAMATKKQINLELRIVAHKGEFVWCKMSSAIHRYDSDGCPIFHAVFTDINDVKLDEEEADRQTELLVKLFKNLPDALFYTSFEEPFKLQIVSSDFMKLIGYSRAELFEGLGGDLRNIIAEQDIPKTEALFKIKQEAMATTYSIKTKNGEYISVLDKRKLVESDDGKFNTIGILSTLANARLDNSFDI